MPLGNQIDSVLKSIFKNSLLVNKAIIFMSNVCNPDIFVLKQDHKLSAVGILRFKSRLQYIPRV